MLDAFFQRGEFNNNLTHLLLYLNYQSRLLNEPV